MNQLIIKISSHLMTISNSAWQHLRKTSPWDLSPGTYLIPIHWASMAKGVAWASERPHGKIRHTCRSSKALRGRKAEKGKRGEIIN